MTGRARIVVAMLAGMLVVGCADGPPAISPARATPSAVGLGSAPASGSVPSTGASGAPGASGGSASPGSGTAAVPVDPSLLDVLPAVVDGLRIERSPESDAVAANDPAVVANGEGVATALVIDAASGQFAHATLVHLKPDVFSDEFFRDWRDTFNEGACSQAGGVSATAETVLAGRTVYIATCAGGVRVYHAWLAPSRVLVSVSSLGERRLGEALVRNLVEPRR